MLSSVGWFDVLLFAELSWMISRAATRLRARWEARPALPAPAAPGAELPAMPRLAASARRQLAARDGELLQAEAGTSLSHSSPRRTSLGAAF
ncbi:hypothetical protein [Paenibacillus hexagrammi]|uniref:Uncharacterized protein n=1 Tax=Paenibacillus hexagrammi TaxID=2908839 RepID=A0ABY3SSC2_9BACL|nr:hypothetical protein [Paenibacillus sp. YPD9-1]UJF36159.1 hypothetical protein L0M14_14490 [Paenibacillus sp. YPD9-1]